MKHTPGPWQEVTDDDGNEWVVPKGHTPNDMHTYFIGDLESTCSECHANAHLIAAAPDLLEACKAALECLEILDDDVDYLSRDEVRQLRAAIKKAEGE